ncbi:MAG TPA: DUF2961 domain-containing protein [Anaerohalosphaeraceae bacterium]|nr:DUF2961 domain-containing protein [Anaerohalosphaeraceae bacterium]HOL87770.1 DUF2961 domain-containing protein [Anaerohalosphaeraceae bacterium]HPP55122.1 DUF2961 domain-containing protein [Anaerohalosphaeraceae bacterium]
MKQCKDFGIFFLLFFLGAQWGQAQTEYRYADLVNRLTDLEGLARLPEEGLVCRQWSSYDRSSRYDEKTGKYVKWDANDDGFGGRGWIRVENDKLVLAEMEGPGCIWRIWSATPQRGHVRIYLDGAEQPAVDLPFADYFSGKVAPFNRPALVHIVANGKNNYTPIPFQKSCRIIADRDYGEFHHFTYTLFPKGTRVPTFSMQMSEEDNAALDRVNDLLLHVGPGSFRSHPEQITQTYTINLQPGKKEQIVLEGKRAIASIKVRPDLPNDTEERRKALREMTIQIFWDHQSNPSVWSPLGDFFGTGPGLNPYRSLPMGMNEQEFYSNWYMPFEQSAAIELLNEGEQVRRLTVEITHAPHSMPAGSYGYFHAKWHRDAFLPTEKERQIDWPMLKTDGRGRFVGVALMVWNPRGGWWGEGDEKFFVDGEKFPSLYGTGSEDYFGYAWSDPTLFEHAFHNQPLSEGNKGHVSVNRWHIADQVPFQRSFEGCIEKYFSNTRPTQYACTAYWYLSAEGRDPYGPLPPQERVDYYTRLTYPMDIAGIYVLEKPVGQLEEQHMGAFPKDKWQNDTQLWWVGQPGAQLKIGIQIPRKGRYQLTTRLTKAADYGIVQFYLDGKKIGKPIDLFYPDGVIATEPIVLGRFTLGRGLHVLTAEIAGSNPAAIQRYMFGMDYLDVKKVWF